jgi:hypothetical protein
MSTRRARLRGFTPAAAPVVFRPRKLEESVTHRPRHRYRVRIAFYFARL